MILCIPQMHVCRIVVNPDVFNFIIVTNKADDKCRNNYILFS